MKLGKYIIPPPLCLPLVIHQLSLKRTPDVGNANNIIEVALLSEESKSKHLQFAATDVTDHIFFLVTSSLVMKNMRAGKHERITLSLTILRCWILDCDGKKGLMGSYLVQSEYMRFIFVLE